MAPSQPPGGAVWLDSQVHDGRCALGWHEVGLSQVAVGESAGLGSALIRSALSAVEEGGHPPNLGSPFVPRYEHPHVCRGLSALENQLHISTVLQDLSRQQGRIVQAF